jgi:large subunit ribosomal protein L9
MKVILLKDVKGVGRRGDTKDVADGYGRNFLLATKAAMLASSENLAKHKAWLEETGRRGAMSAAEAKKSMERINGKDYKMEVKINEKGVLFAAVSIEKVAELVGVSADCLEIEHPIKDSGVHEISARLGEETAKFKLHLLSKDA